jgi:hypothetical protein
MSPVFTLKIELWRALNGHFVFAITSGTIWLCHASGDRPEGGREDNDWR